MSNTITTIALKPHLGPDGVIVQVGETITVDEARHRQLSRKGYVPKGKGENDVSGGERPRRDGLTNADFEPRRQAIVGDGRAEKPSEMPKAKTSAKAKAPKTT